MRGQLRVLEKKTLTQVNDNGIARVHSERTKGGRIRHILVAGFSQQQHTRLVAQGQEQLYPKKTNKDQPLTWAAYQRQKAMTALGKRRTCVMRT
jgi:hypothetical protein